MTRFSMIARTACAAAVAAVAVAGTAAPASAQVIGCDAPGHSQVGGALIGALLGGALGSNLAKNDRGTGTAIGALAGAAGGSYLGCKRQQESYARNSYAAPAYARAFDGSAAGPYVASRTVNVRAAPSTGAGRVGQLYAGQSFQAVGRDNGWIVVRAGSGYGYVHGAYVEPSRGYQTAAYGY